MGVPITREEERMTIFNLAKIVSKKAARLIWGGGFLTNSASDKDKLRLEEIWEANSLLDILTSTERSLSERTNGNQYWSAIPVMKKGKPMIRIDMIDMEQSLFQNAQNGELLSARTYKAPVKFGDMEFRIMQIWTPTRMETKVDMLSSTSFGYWEPISITKYNSQVPSWLREPEFWDYSDLGYIPIITFTNTLSTFADDESDLSPVQQLQKLIDATTFATFKELRNNSTRVISHGIGNSRMRNADGSTNWDVVDSDLFTSIGKQKNIDPTNAQKLIEILQADPKLDKYETFINFCIDKGLEFSGYASNGSSDANRTSAGTIFTKTGDVETTRYKRQQRENTLKNFIETIIEIDEIWNGISYESKDSASITINENKVFDDQFKLDKLKLGSELGLWTKAEQIALLKDTDDKDFIENNIKELESEKAEEKPEQIIPQKQEEGE